jgi:hypothetical protein
MFPVFLEEFLFFASLFPFLSANICSETAQFEVLHGHLHGFILFKRVRLVCLIIRKLVVHVVILVSYVHLSIYIILSTFMLNLRWWLTCMKVILLLLLHHKHLHLLHHHLLLQDSRIWEHGHGHYSHCRHQRIQHLDLLLQESDLLL